MTDAAYRNYFAAVEARRNAHFALRSKLPGRVIYAKAELRRAITKWRAYTAAMKAGK